MDEVARLRENILEQVRRYYEAAHRPGQTAPFVPEESRIGYAGRVYGAEEMVDLVDAALEFWLTSGRWTAAFEEGLAAFFGLPAALIMTFLIWKVTSNAIETRFYIPWKGVVIAVASVFIVVFATMLYATRRIRRDNPIDALKNENL